MAILLRVMWNHDASTLIERLFYNFAGIDVPRFSVEETLNFKPSNFSTLVQDARRGILHIAQDLNHIYISLIRLYSRIAAVVYTEYISERNAYRSFDTILVNLLVSPPSARKCRRLPRTLVREWLDTLVNVTARQ